MAQTPGIASRGYFSAASGAPQLLHALTKSSDSSSSSSSSTGGVAVQQLGGDALPFSGVRVGDWVVGSHKTHITPLDDMDKCVRRI